MSILFEACSGRRNVSKTYVEKIDDNLWAVKPEYNGIEYQFFFGFIGLNRMRLPRSIFEHAMTLIVEMQG